MIKIRAEFGRVINSIKFKNPLFGIEIITINNIDINAEQSMNQTILLIYCIIYYIIIS